MRREVRRVKTTMLAAALLLAGMTAEPRGAGAQTPRACELLTGAEVGAVVGGTVGPPQETNLVVPDGPSKGETMGMCTWPAASRASVAVAVMRAPQGAQREAALAQFRQAFQILKSQGWSEQRRDFANGTCALMTPPSAKTGLPVSTGCFAEAKGQGISVGHNGASGVAMDKVRALLDKAIGRLP